MCLRLETACCPVAPLHLSCINLPVSPPPATCRPPDAHLFDATLSGPKQNRKKSDARDRNDRNVSPCCEDESLSRDCGRCTASQTRSHWRRCGSVPDCAHSFPLIRRSGVNLVFFIDQRDLLKRCRTKTFFFCAFLSVLLICVSLI